MTGGAIAGKPNEYFSYICPPVFKRKRTADGERNALDMLKAYRDFNKISKERYLEIKSEIKKAPDDDTISNIMTRIRHSIKW